MCLLTDRPQADIEERLAKGSRPCIVVNRKMVDFWMQGKSLNSSMATYVKDKYQYPQFVNGHLREGQVPI